MWEGHAFTVHEMQRCILREMRTRAYGFRFPFAVDDVVMLSRLDFLQYSTLQTVTSQSFTNLGAASLHPPYSYILMDLRRLCPGGKTWVTGML